MGIGRWFAAGAVVVLTASGTPNAVYADEIITLGTTVSVTGQNARAGVDTKNGYNLAVRQINEKGGVEVGGKHYQLKVRYYDDESTTARARELVERLIQNDGIRYILGPYSAGQTQAILPTIERSQVPVVEAGRATRSLLSKGSRYVFAVLSMPDTYFTQSLELAVAYSSKFGKAARELTLALATQKDPLSQDVRAGVLSDAMRLGIACVIDDQLPNDLSDMSVTLDKVKTLKPDLLVVSGHEKGATTALKQIASSGASVPMVAMTHCNAARLARSFPSESANVFCPVQWDSTIGYKGALFGTAEDFARRFEKVYGYEAPHQAAQAAAAVYVFADAFERAQSLEPEKVRDAISATNLSTFFGPIKFDSDGKNIAKSMVLTQILDGDYVVVAPKEWAKREPVIPRAGQ